MFTLRFDMRAPDWAAPAADLYAAAIDMCAWAETRGAIVAVLSEHHGADDGHLPTPLILASAIAARTKQLAILLAAVPIPLWDPVRLAEEMCVLDLISKGRVLYALRHRPSQRGVRPFRREHDNPWPGRRRDSRPCSVGLVHGEAVEYRGRRIRVTPPCGSAAGPPMMIAGGSKAAARRAADARARLHLADRLAGSRGSSTSRSAASPGTSRASCSFRYRALRQRLSSPTMSTRRGRYSGHTWCTTR